MGQKAGPLTVDLILAWADDHKARTGEFPRVLSVPVLANSVENWKPIDQALRIGLGGLPGGDSLMRL
jgi:hypothetical protein